MLCEKCKEREANVRFTEVFNGKVTEHNLCLECARSTAMNGQNYAALFNGENPLSRLLSGLLGMAGRVNGEDENQLGEQVVCPVCKTSYGEFVKKSKFGCADCYEVFELLMEDHIKNLQGSSNHRGKRPMKKRSEALAKAAEAAEASVDVTVCDDEGEENRVDGAKSATEQIEELKQQLQVVLFEEEYEEAARIRDEIRALQKNLEESADSENAAKPEESVASESGANLEESVASENAAKPEESVLPEKEGQQDE